MKNRQTILFAALLFASFCAEAQKQRGQLVTESKPYELSLNRVKIDLQVVDAQSRQPIPLRLLARNQMGQQRQWKLPARAVHEIVIGSDTVYTFLLESDLYQDTSFQFGSYREHERLVLSLNRRREPHIIEIRDLSNNSHPVYQVVVRQKEGIETFVIERDQFENGRYRLMLRLGDDYEVEFVSQQTGWTQTQSFTVNAIDTVSKITLRKVDMPPQPMARYFSPVTWEASLEKPLALVYFEYASPSLTSQSRQVLDDFARTYLQKYPQARILIEGHADEIGDSVKNVLLSRARAHSVKEYLVVKWQLPADFLQVKGLGATRPLVSNRTAEGRARNRRAELFMLPPKE